MTYGQVRNDFHTNERYCVRDTALERMPLLEAINL